MNQIFETSLVVLIVTGAAFYVIRSFYLAVFKQKTTCSCPAGKSGSCAKLANATAQINAAAQKKQ